MVDGTESTTDQILMKVSAQLPMLAEELDRRIASLQAESRDYLQLLTAEKEASKSLRRRNAELEVALRRLHDECSYLRREEKYLNLGPMMEPSEAAVLQARALLSLAPQGKGDGQVSDILDYWTGRAIDAEQKLATLRRRNAELAEALGDAIATLELSRCGAQTSIEFIDRMKRALLSPAPTGIAGGGVTEDGEPVRVIESPAPQGKGDRDGE